MRIYSNTKVSDGAFWFAAHQPNRRARNSLQLVVLLCLFAQLVFSHLAWSSEDATAYVRLTIEPTVSVELLSDDIHVVTQDSAGVAEVTVGYVLKGNHDRVALGCEATDLFKAWHPLSQFIVPLDKIEGCTITAGLARPLDNGSSKALFNAVSSSTLVDLPSFKTNMITFESAQYAQFSMNVHLKVKYRIDPAQRTPIGNYGGYIKLYAMTVP